jgi:hypothetical protein
MYGSAAGLNSTSAQVAAGIVAASATDLWFEGDVDGSGVISSVRHQLVADANGNCPCTIQRSAVNKLSGSWTSQSTSYSAELDNVINSIGTAVAGLTISHPDCRTGSSPPARKCIRSIMRTYLLAALLLLALGAYAQTQPADVADAAKNAKPVKKARRIITNDDIPSKPEPEVAPAKPDEAAAAAAPSAETAKPETEKVAKPEESDAVKAAQKKVDDLKAHLESIQQQIADIDKKIDGATDDQVRDALKSAQDGKKEFTTELTKEITQAEQELETAKSGSTKPAESTAGTTEAKPLVQQE